MQATAGQQAKKLFSEADGVISFVIHNTSGVPIYLDTAEFQAGSSDEAITLLPNEKLIKEYWWADLWIACDPGQTSVIYRYIRSYLSKHSMHIGGH